VITAAHLHSPTATQLPELPPGNILSEPVGRNTAAAIGLAARHVMRLDPDAVMLVLPADHVIPDSAAFCTSLQHAVELARGHNLLMTLGVQPTFPATGYGYIQVGMPLSTPGGAQAYQAARFLEKPTAEVAGQLVMAGDYFWNCGIFVWRAGTIAQELETYLPDLWHGLSAYDAAWQSQANTATLRQAYASLRSISIDHGVLEYSSRVGVLPVTWAWSDVGSWRSLADLHPADSTGNVVIGTHLHHGSSGLIVYSPDKLVATIGVHNLIIVQTDDALLICPKDRDQDVREIVNLLHQQQLPHYL
jgi:mannose-1-phosphate guanylyltransferase